MNRQRKFKVWDKLAQRMIYPDKGYQQHYIIDLYGRFHNLQNGSGGDDYVVIEYTGLIDKNGVEIYEGDIVKFDDSLISLLIFTFLSLFVKKFGPNIGFSIPLV